MKTNLRALRFLLTLALLVPFLRATPARAAVTHTVNSLADPGDGVCDPGECTLREALAISGVGDTVDFSVTGAILLASQLSINTPLNISGPGASNLTLSGSSLTRVVSTNSSTLPVNLSGITIANGGFSVGVTGDGAGIYNLGMLTLDNVVVQSNTSNGTNGGGGIYNGTHASLTITNSAFVNNTSPNRGGGIANYGTLSVTNSTFSGNVANAGNGGGIFTFGTLTVSHSTFSGNTSTTNGSGIYNGIATLTLRNSILANGTNVDCYNGATTKPPAVAGNLIETNASGANACGTPAISADPLLSSLANHGGSTPNFDLLPGSPAIDAASDTYCTAADQRGITRPQGAHCDIGAVETVPSGPVPVVQSITLADPNPTSAASVRFTVTFTQPVTGVDKTDFVITASGLTNTSILAISGVDTTYTVTVDSGLGNGTLRLDLIDDDSILNGYSQPLGGSGAGNGNFNGESYNVNKMITFASTAAQDGWVLEVNENGNIGGTFNSTAATLRVGDDAFRRQYRSIVSFNTSALQDTAVILGGTLKIKQQSVSGPVDPFVLFGGMVLEIRNGYFGSLANLQAADFQNAASVAQSPLSPPAQAGWYAFPLDSSLWSSINKLTAQSGLTQFRLRFWADDNNDSVANYVSFHSGNAILATDRPVLEVYYYLP